MNIVYRFTKDPIIDTIMKYFFKFRPVLRLLGPLFVCLFLVNCKKDDQPQQPQSLSDVFTDDANFSVLSAAIKHAALGDALKTGSLTIFAPTNDAFKAAGFNDVAAVTAQTPAAIRNILQYHVLKTKLPSASVPTGDNLSVVALNGVSLFITRTNNGFFVNGARVTLADQEASNGVIHTIDRVLVPSILNVSQTIETNPNFTFVNVALKRIIQLSPVLGATLNNQLATTENITVFLPTDDAFRTTSAFTTLGSIQNASAANVVVLANVLGYHAVRNRLFTNTLEAITNAGTARGSLTSLNNNRTIELSFNATTKIISLKGANNGNNLANVLGGARNNIITKNGVIHAIDRVLLP